MMIGATTLAGWRGCRVTDAIMSRAYNALIILERTRRSTKELLSSANRKTDNTINPTRIPKRAHCGNHVCKGKKHHNPVSSPTRLSGGGV